MFFFLPVSRLLLCMPASLTHTAREDFSFSSRAPIPARSPPHWKGREGPTCSCLLKRFASEATLYSTAQLLGTRRYLYQTPHVSGIGQVFWAEVLFSLFRLRRTKKTETHSGGRVFYRGWLLSLCADQ